MLTEMIEYGQKLRKKGGYVKWNKEKHTGEISEGKETGTEINDLEQK